MQFAEKLTFIILGLFTTAVAATAGGTILWLIWNDSVTAMFPSAVSAGVLAATLTWWQSVKIVWVFGILLKTTVETTKTVEKIIPSKFRSTNNNTPL